MSTQRTSPPPSALLSFTASNVRSYRDEFTFSLLATRLAREDIRRELHTRSFKTPTGVLPAAGVFGANASGKSTMLFAMDDMRAIVVSSFRGYTFKRDLSQALRDKARCETCQHHNHNHNRKAFTIPDHPGLPGQHPPPATATCGHHRLMAPQQGSRLPAPGGWATQIALNVTCLADSVLALAEAGTCTCQGAAFCGTHRLMHDLPPHHPAHNAWNRAYEAFVKVAATNCACTRPFT